MRARTQGSYSNIRAYTLLLFKCACGRAFYRGGAGAGPGCGRAHLFSFQNGWLFPPLILPPIPSSPGFVLTPLHPDYIHCTLRFAGAELAQLAKAAVEHTFLPAGEQEALRARVRAGLGALGF